MADTSMGTWQPGFSVESSTMSELGVGGRAVPLKAAAALDVGDAVFLSAADTVNRGATANKGSQIGVVVGGAATRFRTMPEVPVGTAAATAAGQVVLVAVGGVASVVADAAVAVGDRLVFAATAGRVIAGADLTIAAGATSVTSTAANGNIIVGDGRRNVLGIALTAAAGAGSAFRALITN